MPGRGRAPGVSRAAGPEAEAACGRRPRRPVPSGPAAARRPAGPRPAAPCAAGRGRRRRPPRRSAPRPGPRRPRDQVGGRRPGLVRRAGPEHSPGDAGGHRRAVVGRDGARAGGPGPRRRRAPSPPGPLPEQPARSLGGWLENLVRDDAGSGATPGCASVRCTPYPVNCRARRAPSSVRSSPTSTATSRRRRGGWSTGWRKTSPRPEQGRPGTTSTRKAPANGVRRGLSRAVLAGDVLDGHVSGAEECAVAH